MYSEQCITMLSSEEMHTTHQNHHFFSPVASPSLNFCVSLLLTGKPNLEVTPQNAIAVLGETLTLSCHYPCKYYSHEKYWCKWSNKGCHILPSHNEAARQSSVSCDQDNQVISMTLNPVSKNDEGWYWCGVRKGQDYGETTAIYVAVEERTGGKSPRVVSACTPQHPWQG